MLALERCKSVQWVSIHRKKVTADMHEMLLEYNVSTVGMFPLKEVSKTMYCFVSLRYKTGFARETCSNVV